MGLRTGFTVPLSGGGNGPPCGGLGQIAPLGSLRAALALWGCEECGRGERSQAASLKRVLRNLPVSGDTAWKSVLIFELVSKQKRAWLSLLHSSLVWILTSSESEAVGVAVPRPQRFPFLVRRPLERQHPLCIVPVPFEPRPADRQEGDSRPRSAETRPRVVRVGPWQAWPPDPPGSPQAADPAAHGASGLCCLLCSYGIGGGPLFPGIKKPLSFVCSESC